MAHNSNIQAKWNATFNSEEATISCPDSCLLTQAQIVNLIIDVKILGWFMAVMTINTSIRCVPMIRL